MRGWFPLSAFVVAGVLAWPAASPQAQGGPRTPWGDPDLQGTYTNTYEQGTPLERPEQFAGRTARGRVRRRAGADPAGDPEADDHGLRGADPRARPLVAGQPVPGAGQPGVVRRRSTRRAHSAADARGAAAQRRPRRGAQGQRARRSRLVDRSQPLRPLPDPRRARLDDAGHLRQLVGDRPGPGLRGDPQRDDPRGARDPARRPRPPRAGDHPGHGRRARALGRRHAGGRDHQLQGRAASIATPIPPGSS